MSLKNIVPVDPPKSVFKRCGAPTETKVVIVILGFAGAKPKHLEKYEQIYHKRGYDTLTYTAPLEEDPNSMLLKDRRDVSGIVADLKHILKTRDTALHLLSMNSIFTLCCIELQHPEIELLAHSKGILFDSCPIELGFKSVGRFYQVWDVAYADMLKTANLYTRIKYRAQSVVEISRLIKLYSYLAFRRSMGLDVRDWSSYEFLIEHPHLPRVLSFVNSHVDDICEAEHSVHFALVHKKRGRTVDILHLLDSPHVQHLRMYPKEYKILVDRFVDSLSIRSKL